jgi:arsenate reductase
VATFGLVLVILRAPAARVAAMVACYIGAAYWFTASTSFANPAAAFGRMFSDSFAGIAPSSVPGFVVAELIGAAVAVLVHRVFRAAPVAPQVTPLEDRPRPSPLLMPDVTIYHNPSCGTSRNTLALIRHAGIEPAIVEYLKNPPSRETLRQLIAAMAISVRALLREKGTQYAELKLDDANLSDEDLLDAMLRDPILINRPIVVTPLGTMLCRPSEAVLEILPSGKMAPFTREDGEVVEDTGHRRG